MAQPVFSTVLWELGSGWTPPGPVLSPPVPSGFVWVARSVVAFHPLAAAGQAVALLRFFVDGFPSFMTPASMSQPGVVYSAGDVRFVLEAGSFFSVEGNDGQWQLRVSGYQLTL